MKNKICVYQQGSGGTRMDCINAFFKKIKRPLCKNCRTRINFAPKPKPETEVPTNVLPEESTNHDPEHEAITTSL